MSQKGRVTIPTDQNIVDETIRLAKQWGADAVRDCDGTDFPVELADAGLKVYATYYTTRKDNAWAKAHPEEIQQMYVMTPAYTAVDESLNIPLMKGLHEDMLCPNCDDDIARWWEVIDRSTGETVAASNWSYEKSRGEVAIHSIPFHDYTVSFLAYILWDPVHMYNATVNDWKDVEHQLTFDVRQPKTHTYTMERLKTFIKDHPYVNVLRFTTFFHQFTLLFDELRREKYVDWYGYSASVSPYILKQFERECGYPFRPEYIIDQGYYNNQYRIPTKEYQDFIAFQQREVALIIKEMVDIAHASGKEAMMFLGDHWIGTEPFLKPFSTTGIDAVVGSVGNGSTLRLISDIEGVSYTEGRLLPYFFPDTFYEGGDPVKEAKYNWVTARRAILRKPVDRIGYGGYLKLALDFPEFVDYVASVCEEFRTLYDKIKGRRPYCAGKVAVLNCWGKMRAWGCHMVHHAIYFKQNYSYAGVIEALSGAPFDVSFISFSDVKEHPALLDDFDVLFNIGDADTAHTGGEWWCDPVISSAVKRYVYRGGGMIGVGEPSAHQANGRFFQLASIFGVEKERGFTLGYDKYNWDCQKHFITEDCVAFAEGADGHSGVGLGEGENSHSSAGLKEGADGRSNIDFGEGARNIYALEGTAVLVEQGREVRLAANCFGKGRAVYLSGLPYSFANNRLLHRAILWSAAKESELYKWYSDNPNTEVHAYDNGKFCVVNNTDTPQDTVVYRGDSSSFTLRLDGGQIMWYD